MDNTTIDDMFRDGLQAVSTLTNPSNHLAQQQPVFSNHSSVPSSVHPFLVQRQTSSYLQQPATSTGTVAGNLVPAVSETSKTVYHRMTSPQLMSWPISQTMDPATIRRLMTPLHVVTSFENDTFPLRYSQDVSTTQQGGGLLKIATEAQQVPQCGSWYSSNQRPSYGGPAMTWQRPSSCPSLPVAAGGMRNEGIGGMKRPASEEPAPNVHLPQLKRRKSRSTFTKEQIDTMEAHFQRSMYLTIRERVELAQQLEMEDSQVKTWFQNRRMRWKRQHPEKQLTPARPPSSRRRSRTQVVRPMQCPLNPPTSQPDQFVVPTPPPSAYTPSVSVVPNITGKSSSEPAVTYPLLPPSSLCNYGVMAPSSTLQENCCPAQAVYGVPVFHHHLPGFGMHPWMSSNAVGPQGGVQYPYRHV